MAVTHDKVITLINGESAVIPPYRRVKYHSSAGEVVYADASDGDSWIGITEPMSGGNPANGAPVAIRLRHEGATFKAECSAAVTANAPIYPENDGKISDDAGTVVIGTAAGTGTGAGAASIVAFHPNAGSGSVPDEESIANADGTTGAGIPILLTLLKTATNTEEIQKPNRKLQIIDAWFFQRGTTETDVTLQEGANVLSRAAVAAGTTADVRGALDLVDTYDEIDAASTLYASLNTEDAVGVEIFILALPIA